MRGSVALTALLAAWILSAGEARYLSADGSDGNDGLTPATAWATIARLNEGLPSGATAYLRSGDVFYGTITVRGGIDSSHPTVVTAYGEGAKPVISNTRNLRNDPSLWVPNGLGAAGGWKFNLADRANSTGADTDDTNVGFLLVDGEVRPWKRYCPHDVNGDWDFCNDADGFLHVHLEENPALAAKDIRAAVNLHGLVFASHMVISNIAVRYVGGHGFCGNHVTGIRVSNCEFENIGGAELKGFMPGDGIRYGNGVEFWKSASDAIVERCRFRGIYDVAVTMQGDHPETGWSDIHFRACEMRECSQALEVWVLAARPGIGFRRCSFTGNRTFDVGGGWGALTRPNRSNATPLLIALTDSDTFDIDISGNTFTGYPRGLLTVGGGIENLPTDCRIHDNITR